MIPMLTYMYFGTNDLERAIVFYNATLGARRTFAESFRRPYAGLD